MTIEGLGWTNTWLGVLAILSLIEFLMIAAVGLFAYRLYRQAMTTIQTIEQRHIAPLRAKVEAVIEDAKGVIDRAEEIVGQVRHAEESVKEAVKFAASAGGLVVESMRAKTWPILGIVRGVRVAVAAMRNGRSHDEAPPAGVDTPMPGPFVRS